MGFAITSGFSFLWLRAILPAHPFNAGQLEQQVLKTMNQQEQYASYKKKAWIIYSLAAVVLAALLVLFVARDAEEQFFYGLMVIAGAYVFRPTERFMAKQIKKYTGVSKPAEEES